MSKRLLKWAAVFVLLLPATAEAQQDPMTIVEGARVYSNNCARCHNARASSERTDLEWVVIVMHMRARGNLTKGQAKAVLAFLQATNLPETSAPGVARGLGAMTAMPEALHAELLTVSTGQTDDPRPGGEREWNR